jgi:hypothetical protein
MNFMHVAKTEAGRFKTASFLGARATQFIVKCADPLALALKRFEDRAGITLA